MKLKQGDFAIDYEFEDAKSEKKMTIKEYASAAPLYLTFFRYASCPFCNLRIHNLIYAHEDFNRYGIKILAVMESTKEVFMQYAGRQPIPFSLALDPEHELYRKYQVQESMFGLMKTFVVRPLDMFKAMSLGFNPGTVDAPMGRMPADFLINADFSIEKAHYGNDAGDHLPLREIFDFAKKRN